MAGGKLTPRQRMINMMYLVLTAMLALNVSAEVLNAFVIIEKALNQSIITMRKKNMDDLTDFGKAAVENPAKVGEWYKKAKIAHDKTDSLFNRIHALKIAIIRTGDGAKTKAIDSSLRINVDLIDALDNTDAAPHIMLGEMRSGEAYKLRDEIDEYKKFLLRHVDSTSNAFRSINEVLTLEDPPTSSDGTFRSWETAQFESVPLVSAIALLSKQQLDIVTCENEILIYLRNQINATDFKFSNIEAALIPTSTYIIKGQKFTAKAFLTAFDPNANPKLQVSNGAFRSIGNGQYEIETSSENIGTQKLTATMTFDGPDGKPQKSSATIEYFVAEPNVVVSPTKMNVVYRGIDNPLSISMSGVSLDKLEPKTSNGNIRKSGNEFILKPGDGKTCDVTIFMDSKNMGTISFRVKNLPTPAAAVFGLSGKTANKNELAAAEGLIAEMKDFDFDLKYKITSFRVSVTINGYEKDEASQSEMLTEKQRQLISSAKSGQRVYFTDIKAVGPDGRQIELYDLALKLR